MKKVVVVGGGFAGALVAKKLEDKFYVTLIDKKDYFEFTPSILRAIVQPKHIDMIESKHKNYLKKSSIIMGEVTEASSREIKIKQKNNKRRKIGFDYLVIASGSRYNSPIKEKNLFISSSRSDVINKSHKKLIHAKDILIIGGGVVGTELAAEISTHYPEKNITIVHSKEGLIERQNKKARAYAEDFFKKRKVKIIFNERVVKRKGKNYVTDKGTKIKTGLAFVCTGITSNCEFLKKNFSDKLNERGQVKVNSFLQVTGHRNIFAAGDITAIKEEKLAQSAEKQARVVARNIVGIDSNTHLIRYDSEKRPMVISLGQWDGLLTYKKFSFGGIIPGIMKTIIEWKTMIKYKI